MTHAFAFRRPIPSPLGIHAARPLASLRRAELDIIDGCPVIHTAMESTIAPDQLRPKN